MVVDLTYTGDENVNTPFPLTLVVPDVIATLEQSYNGAEVFRTSQGKHLYR